MLQLEFRLGSTWFQGRCAFQDQRWPAHPAHPGGRGWSPATRQEMLWSHTVNRAHLPVIHISPQDLGEKKNVCLQQTQKCYGVEGPICTDFCDETADLTETTQRGSPGGLAGLEKPLSALLVSTTLSCSPYWLGFWFFIIISSTWNQEPSRPLQFSLLTWYRFYRLPIFF